MFISAKALRALALAAVLLAATIFSLTLPSSPARAQGLLDSMFGGSGEPGISIGDGEDLVQVDEACVLIRGGGELLSIGDRCPQTTSNETDKPAAPPEPTSRPEGTTPEAKPEANPETPAGTPTGTTTGTTTDGEDESGLQEVTVKRAVDGDTLEISPDLYGTDMVRLIGLDTPEMATNEAAVPEPYAEEAAAFTAESLEGAQIFLELDADLKDDYGRLLAYAWLEDPATDPDNSELFNESLLREGYATLFTVEPNVLYEDRLVAAEAAAQSEGLGVWGLEQPEETTTAEPTAQPVAQPTAQGTVPESTNESTTKPAASTTGDTAPSTTTEMPVDEPQAVPAGDPDPLDLPEEDPPSTSSTSGLESEDIGGGTTVTASEDQTETTMDGTTMGGTTMMGDPGLTGAESFDPATFDPEVLKKEATQLAQESLEEAGIEPPQAPEELSSVTPQVPSATPTAGPTETPTEVPVSQMTEAPVSVLPDTGGPKIWVFGALVLITGLAGMAAFDRMTARAPSVKDEDGAGSDDGLGR